MKSPVFAFFFAGRRAATEVVDALAGDVTIVAAGAGANGKGFPEVNVSEARTVSLERGIAGAGAGLGAGFGTALATAGAATGGDTVAGLGRAGGAAGRGGAAALGAGALGITGARGITGTLGIAGAGFGSSDGAMMIVPHFGHFPRLPANSGGTAN